MIWELVKNRAFPRFAKLLFELTRTSLFQTSNKLECVHQLVIELEYPIFGFERSNIELRTLFDPSLYLQKGFVNVFYIWTSNALENMSFDQFITSKKLSENYLVLSKNRRTPPKKNHFTMCKFNFKRSKERL